MNSFFTELKRRNVVRVAGVYSVVGWLLMQLSTQLEGSLNLPSWFDTFVTVFVLIGFPVALILAWAFEMTPDGVKPTANVSETESIAPQTGRKLNGVLIGLLVVAVGGIFWQTKNGKEKIHTKATVAVPIAEEGQSIAVLPFVALSADENDTFFGKGIAEELLNSLTQFPDLKVAARTSAFSFEGRNVDLREVGETLGVAHVLEGSIRRSGNKLRITAQLIRSADGFHLWSNTYDREMTDIFEIQDEIVAEVSQVLQFRLGVGVGSGRASSAQTSPQAYESYLKGLDLWWERDAKLTNRRDAIAAFLSVTEQDPNFADGWAVYANSLALSSRFASPHLTLETWPIEVEAAYSRALELDPENIRALAGQIYWYTTSKMNIERAKTVLDRARTLAPHDSFVQYMAAIYALTVGDEAAARRAMTRTLDHDPLNLTKQRVDMLLKAGWGDYDLTHPYIQRVRNDVDACSATKNCSQDDIWNLVFYLMPAVIQAGNSDQIAQTQEVLEKVNKGRDPSVQLPGELVTCWKAVFSQLINQNDFIQPEKTKCILELDSPAPLLDVSANAILGHRDEALEALFTPVVLHHALKEVRGYFALTDGGYKMPDTIRRHPKYHEWWSRPGFPELAAARRANGKTAGLPLPIEDE